MTSLFCLAFRRRSSRGRSSPPSVSLVFDVRLHKSVPHELAVLGDNPTALDHRTPRALVADNVGRRVAGKKDQVGKISLVQAIMGEPHCLGSIVGTHLKDVL